jgi:serine protease Do
MEKPRGALVAKILPGSPAEAAKFKVGDIIVNFNGTDVERSSELPPIVGSTKIGTTAKTTILRNGEEITLDVTIGELPAEDDIVATTKGGKGGKSITSDRLGMSVRDLTEKERETLDIAEGGVIVEHIKTGIARDAGIRKGDVILKMGDSDIQNPSQFKEILAKIEPGQSVPILIHRGDSPLFLALKIPAKK